MGETPNDSGDSPASDQVDDSAADEPTGAPLPNEAEVEAVPGISWRNVDWKMQVRRPAVWGLLLLIGVVLLAQVWLLYL